MNAKFRQVTPFVRPGSVRAAPRYTSRLGLFGLYKTSALVVILCLVYLDIPTYIFAIHKDILPKYFYYAFFVVVAPLLI